MKQLSFLSSSAQQSSAEPANYWKLYVDGASRNNPGPAGIGICIMKNEQIHAQYGFYVGTKTNNQAEYLALIIGVYLLRKNIHQNDTILLISDSQLLIRQLSGQYKVKHPELRSLHMIVKELLEGLQWSATHVLREDNVLADAMANKGIDDKIPLPAECLTMLRRYDLSL